MFQKPNRGADLLAVNADGNMPYDICEDEQTLDFIESEMSKRGVTQELIDTTRARTENRMLADMKKLATQGYDLNYKDEQGATPVSSLILFDVAMLMFQCYSCTLPPPTDT